MIHFLVSGLLAAALSVFPSWKEGTLDIHMSASSYGENTFVVMPDGTTMLIDAGDRGTVTVPPDGAIVVR